GESFAEIFHGNAIMLGIPCFAADRPSIERLQGLIEKHPELTLRANVESGEVTAGAESISSTIPPAFRDALLSGQWNPTSMFLDRYGEVRAVADRLPYVSGF